MNATKDQYETCLSAKYGECPFAERIVAETCEMCKSANPQCGKCCRLCIDACNGAQRCRLLTAGAGKPFVLRTTMNQVAELKVELNMWKKEWERMELRQQEERNLNQAKQAMLTITEKERDRWKARAEAQERALMQFSPCCSCVHRNFDIETYPCADCSDALINYKFDEARFSKEAEAK